jgi:ribosomal protein L11 methyltransferase
LLDRFAEAGDAAALFEVDEKRDDWILEVFLVQSPTDLGDIERQATVVALEPVAPRDWVAESQRQLPPVRAGRFYVHGSHDRGTTPAGAVALEIEAGRAFGTGLHGTTQGCLVLLDRMLRRRRPAYGLDLGCGSGVLALALAKAMRRPVLATDIDRQAVLTARENAGHNRLSRLVRAVEADGLGHRLLRHRRFDPILANILARPLIRLAPGLARRLAPGGDVILSGLLRHQALPILLAYRREGLRLVRRVDIGEWTSLWLRRS